MTRRRWIADEVAGDRAALLGQNAVHLARVLRVRPGQEFDIACGETVRNGRVIAVAEDRVDFALGAEVAQERLSEITLLLAVFKFDRMEWAVEKATELGVARILPVFARRTDAHLVTAAAKRTDRWRRIVREASQQSRRAGVPEVAAPVKLMDALSAVDSSAVRVVLSEIEQETSLTDALNVSGDAVYLATGPEGGWTEDELKLFAEKGWTSASLGGTILRAETAAIAAVAIAAQRRCR